MPEDQDSISHSPHESDSDHSHEHEKPREKIRHDSSDSRHKTRHESRDSHHKTRHESRDSHHKDKHESQEPHHKHKTHHHSEVHHSEVHHSDVHIPDSTNRQVTAIYADPPEEIQTHHHTETHTVQQYQIVGAPKDQNQPMSVTYAVPPQTQHHHQEIHNPHHQHESHKPNTHQGSHATPVIMRTRAPRSRIWWHLELSKAAHIFSVTLLFIVIFSCAPSLSYYSWYSDYCHMEAHKKSSGDCTIDDGYRCSVCVIIGYVWVMLAFFTLLARIILWTSTIEFKQKTAKIALIVDLFVVALIFIAVILATVGGTKPHPNGKSDVERDYPLIGDLLFGTEMAIWFALLGMVISIIIDVLDMRSEQ